MSDSVQPHRRQPTRLHCPWDNPGKNTGVGCHFLLQCVKVKSEREVAQSCPTLSDPVDHSLPGSSVHGIFQARALEWGAIAFSDKITSVSKMENLVSFPKFHSLFFFLPFPPSPVPSNHSSIFCSYNFNSSGRNSNSLTYADDTTLMVESEEELKSLLIKVKE